jgi:hypothetical protein
MTAMKLHRHPSPSGGVALGKIGAGVSLVKRLPYKRELLWLKDVAGHKAQISTTLKPENNHVIRWKASLSITNVNWAGIGFITYLNEQTEWTTVRKWFNNSNQAAAYFRHGPGGATPFNLDTTTDHEFELSYNKVVYDGIAVSPIGIPSGISDDRLPYRRIGLYSKLWYFEVEADGVTLIHLKPVVDNNDVVCMYDTVSGALFYSEGGAFEAGPDAAYGAFGYGNDLKYPIPAE